VSLLLRLDAVIADVEADAFDEVAVDEILAAVMSAAPHLSDGERTAVVEAVGRLESAVADAMHRAVDHIRENSARRAALRGYTNLRPKSSSQRVRRRV